MVKVAIMGDLKNLIIKQLPKDFILDYDSPEIVLSFGGDGTFLLGEEKYPGTPRLFIKHFWNCYKCSNHDFTGMFNKLRDRDYNVIELDKIEAHVNGKKELTAMNDINFHYIPPRAVRLDIKVNNKQVDRQMIGDGFVVSTSFGSTGYFSSITRRIFKEGYGIAFNNPVIGLDFIIDDKLLVEARILRGPAVVVADCQEKILKLEDKDTITVMPSKEKARVVVMGKELRFSDF